MTPSPSSYQVARQQKVGNALPHTVLVAAVAAHQLALHNLRLDQDVVQLRQQLVVRGQGLVRRGLLGQRGEAELKR